MSSDVVICTEPCCSSTDTFLCVKHCQRYVCFEHLQEHHRIYEQEKNDLPQELRRKIEKRFTLYNKLLNEKKLDEQEKQDIQIACTEIRRTYEQRRHDYRQLQREAALAIEPKSTLDDLKKYLEKLDVAIEREQLRERVYSDSDTPVNIKVEPSEFMENSMLDNHENNHLDNLTSNSISSSTNVSMNHKDHNSSVDNGEPSDTNMSDTSEPDSDYEDNRQRRTSTNLSSSPSNLNQSVTIYRGPCPLTRLGVFGILPIHNIRVCEGKPSCLYNHLQSFHHMTACSAHKVCKAVVQQHDPILTVLFGAKDILYNKNFHLACPFNQDSKSPFDCQPKYIMKAPCSSIISRLDMPRHLRDVHHVYRNAALKIVAEMRRCAKHSDKNKTVKLNRNLFDKEENIIELINEKDGTKAVKKFKREK